MNSYRVTFEKQPDMLLNADAVGFHEGLAIFTINGEFLAAIRNFNKIILRKQVEQNGN